MDTIIETEHLKKTFRVAKRRPGLLGSLRSIVDPEVRTVEAVKDLSLRIERGEMVGLVGPNGAGKSTSIKMLTGILTPSSGRASVLNMVPIQQRRALMQRTGVVFGQRTQLWWDLPLRDSLNLLQHLYHIPRTHYLDNLSRLSNMLALDEFLTTPVRQLSLGQRMRGDLAAALLHDPELLYLDEPTIGLDVVAKARIREFLLALNAERGTTILLTTHDMDDIEALCPRMLIIDHGRKLYDGTVEAIRTRFGGERTLIALLEASELPTLPRSPNGQPTLQGLPSSVHVRKAEGPRFWLGFAQENIPAHELVAWLGSRYQLRDVTFQEPEIEDVIRRIYEEDLLSKEIEATLPTGSKE